MQHYDYVIVGCGFCGSVLARRLAEECGKTVLIIERRSTIAGNMYDDYDNNGILVQRYGVHVFHTDSAEVYNFLSKFTQWRACHLTCLAEIMNKYVPVPFNYDSIDAFFSDDGDSLKSRLESVFNDMDRVPVLDLINSSDPLIHKFGSFLFEQDYLPYTCKQWGRKPEEIDSSILARVKVALSYDDNFFSNRYQCMPKEGFTKLFANMLNHPNIAIKLNVDFKDIVSFEGNLVSVKGINKDATVIYTGALDYLFDYKYGALPYRSLIFDYEVKNCDKALKAPFEVYPKHPTMTRIVEFKSITGQQMPGKTVIMREYPVEYDNSNKDLEPLYPVLNENNIEIYNKYRKHASTFNNLVICGRLADFKYYDMDSAVLRAFELFKELS